MNLPLTPEQKKRKRIRNLISCIASYNVGINYDFLLTGSISTDIEMHFAYFFWGLSFLFFLVVCPLVAFDHTLRKWYFPETKEKSFSADEYHYIMVLIGLIIPLVLLLVKGAISS